MTTAMITIHNRGEKDKLTPMATTMIAIQQRGEGQTDTHGDCNEHQFAIQHGGEDSLTPVATAMISDSPHNNGEKDELTLMATNVCPVARSAWYLQLLVLCEKDNDAT